MIDDLRSALDPRAEGDARGAAALRLRVRLQPAGGAGTRVMPPTYSGPDGPVYLIEQRRVEDVDVDCVVLDSFASQSNRLEEALLDAIAEGRIHVPDVAVDQGRFGTHSALEFSHRIFDAWVEDAVLGDERFGATELYERLASVINRGVARPLAERFPVGLLLGLWASRRKNPQGSTRIARSITSEIIGYDFRAGKRAAGKIDRQHVAAAVKLVETKDQSRTRFEVADDPKARGAERPSEFGYGNVTPSEARHGGGSVRFAEQQTVVSLPALRAVKLQELGSDQRSEPEQDLAVRERLALLALAMLEAQVDRGWDLRSGCHLIPEQEPTVDLIGRLGQVVAFAPLFGIGAAERLAQHSANGAVPAWDVEPIELRASPQQIELLERSLGQAPEEGSE